MSKYCRVWVVCYVDKSKIIRTLTLGHVLFLIVFFLVSLKCKILSVGIDSRYTGLWYFLPQQRGCCWHRQGCNTYVLHKHIQPVLQIFLFSQWTGLILCGFQFHVCMCYINSKAITKIYKYTYIVFQGSVIFKTKIMPLKKLMAEIFFL